MARLEIKGYGQVELNNVAFRRDGRIEAQCKAANTMEIVENGMLLAVDSVNKTVAPATNGNLPIALVYSAEHVYSEKMGLKDFKLNAKDGYLPRLGYLAKGDKFTTNCVEFDVGADDGKFTNEGALITALGNIKTTPLYGGVSATGAIKVSTKKPTFGPVLEVIEKGTMPDGQLGIKFRVLAD